VKKDSAEINRVVNSTLRNSTVGRFSAAQKTSRFTTALEVERFMAAPEDDRFLVALEIHGRGAFPAQRPGHRPGSQNLLISSTEV
jgi:hypothetical protein